jgi:3-phosphoshikimate 1-carboxyvinyltransferase
MPGDKSISHRALILSALAVGRSTIAGLNEGADVGATARMLAALGAELSTDDSRGLVEAYGGGWPALAAAREPLNAGNSGTSLRVLAGVCAAVPGEHVLTGDASLRSRPMLRVVAPLRAVGATIAGPSGGDRAPLRIIGGLLTGIDHTPAAASAQVKSALLLAGLRASGRTAVTEPRPSRDHTERMLSAAGVDVARSGPRVSVSGGSAVEARPWRIPGDVSAAMFFVAAGAAALGSGLRIDDVGLNPTRTSGLDVLKAMGADIRADVTDEWGGEPVGSIHVTARDRLNGTTVEAAVIPRLIDEIPALTVAATQAEGETVFTGAGELRVKESDRIATLVTGLKILGADAGELPDGLFVRGPVTLRGGEVDACDDHRIAMAFAMAGLFASGPVRIRGWEAVDTSFPGFAGTLAEVRDWGP